MWLLPFQQETLICPFSADEIQQQLQKHTEEHTNSTSPIEAEFSFLRTPSRTRLSFRGRVKDGIFFLQRNTPYPEHFNPIIRGKIEHTERGCLIFVRYHLPRGSGFILYLASFIGIIIGLVFLFLQKSIPNFLLALAFFLGCYSVFYLNFFQKTRISKHLLEKIIYSGESSSNL